MKRRVLLISFFTLLILLTACSKNNDRNTSGAASPTPTADLTEKVQEENNAADNTGNSQSSSLNDELTFKDYYPFQSDTEYVYEGSGNEFASYKTYIDYLDNKNSRIQVRTDNGGTETVKVIELKDGKLSVVYKAEDCYYRENFLDKVSEDKPEVLLMEPLNKGTEWTLPDGSRRYITGTDVKVQTPSGSYKAIEVTTEGKDSQTKDYYAASAGLVKTVYTSGDNEITSSLSRVNKNTPFVQEVTVYYPGSDEKIYSGEMTLTFYTGDITRKVLAQAVKDSRIKASYLPLFGKNTRLNSLYLGKDGIVYADFSKELVNEMNAGSGYELLILQGITNTLGAYYNAQKVYITLDGKPYESGHVLMKKGETFKVNLDNVER